MLIWEQVLDDVWDITVARNTAYTGQLVVKHKTDERVLVDEEVGLAFGAKFGPDVDDVQAWQARSIEAVDAL